MPRELGHDLANGWTEVCLLKGASALTIVTYISCSELDDARRRRRIAGLIICRKFCRLYGVYMLRNMG